MGKSLIKLIDNTTKNDITDFVNQAGYSHVSRQLVPNMGTVISSDEYDGEVYFYNFGMVNISDDLYLIDNANIFICNNKLVKEGVVVERRKLEQGKSFVVRTQDWFSVLDTNCDIPKGSIVVSKKQTAYKFNDNHKQKYFISTEQVMFYLSDAIKVAIDKVLVNKYIPDSAFKKESCLVGRDDEYKYYAEHCVTEITIQNIKKLIFNISDIYSKELL